MQVVIASITALAVLLASPVAAQSRCASSGEVERYLKESHGEAIVAYGMMQSGGVLQIWSNPTTGTFSAVVTDGTISCIAASGENFATVSGRPNL